MTKRIKEGFTLVELIVVLMLMGLITTGIVMVMQPTNRLYADVTNKSNEETASITLCDYLNNELRYATDVRIVYTKNSKINGLSDSTQIPTSADYGVCNHYIKLCNNERTADNLQDTEIVSSTGFDSKKGARGYALKGLTSDLTKGSPVVSADLLDEFDFQFSIEGYVAASGEESITLGLDVHPMKATYSDFVVNTDKPYEYSETFQLVNMQNKSKLTSRVVGGLYTDTWQADDTTIWIFYQKPSESAVRNSSSTTTVSPSPTVTTTTTSPIVTTTSQTIITSATISTETTTTTFSVTMPTTTSMTEVPPVPVKLGEVTILMKSSDNSLNVDLGADAISSNDDGENKSVVYEVYDNTVVKLYPTNEGWRQAQTDLGYDWNNGYCNVDPYNAVNLGTIYYYDGLFYGYKPSGFDASQDVADVPITNYGDELPEGVDGKTLIVIDCPSSMTKPWMYVDIYNGKLTVVNASTGEVLLSDLSGANSHIDISKYAGTDTRYYVYVECTQSYATTPNIKFWDSQWQNVSNEYDSSTTVNPSDAGSVMYYYYE